MFSLYISWLLARQPALVPCIGCAHWQQLIWELFNAVLKGSEDAGETNIEFLRRKSMNQYSLRSALPDTFIPLEIEVARGGLDRGLHIGKWGQLQGAAS